MVDFRLATWLVVVMVYEASIPEFRPLVNKAVQLVGSQKALADAIGRSQQQISALCTRVTTISAEDAIGIHRATRGVVSASELRPDLWRRAEDVPTDLESNSEVA